MLQQGPLIPSVAHLVCFQECRALASLAMLDSLALAAVAQERKKGQPVDPAMAVAEASKAHVPFSMEVTIFFTLFETSLISFRSL